MPVIRGSIRSAVVTQEPPRSGPEQLTVLIKAPCDQVRALLDLADLGAGALDTIVRAAAFGPDGADITVAALGDAVALGKAELDLDGVTGDIDTIIEATTAGEDGNAITIAFVADGEGAGSFTRVGTALTFHYEDAVTTVTDFETAVAALAGGDDLIGVKTAGTGANVFNDPADTLVATPLAGGGNGEEVVETGTDAVIRFIDGVTTVAEIETAIDASTLLEVDTTGTGATVLAAATDEFEATPLVHTAVVLNVDEADGRARHDGSGPPVPCDDIQDQAIDITVDEDGIVTAIAFAS